MKVRESKKGLKCQGKVREFEKKKRGKSGNFNGSSERKSSSIPQDQSESQFLPKYYITKSGKLLCGQGKFREDDS